MARKRVQNRKKSKTFRIIIWLAVWALAIEVVTYRCGGIICRANTGLNVTSQITNSTSGSEASVALPLLASIAQLGGLVQSNWFFFALAGLILVSSVIVVRSILVSWEETRSGPIDQTPLPRPEGIEAVADAIQILQTQTELDPRMRIINSYQSMLQRAQGAGTTVSSGQTARELEGVIRKLLGVNSHAITELTDLFEEARYSLHPITEDDAERAQQCLLDISRQMDRGLAALRVET